MLAFLLALLAIGDSAGETLLFQVLKASGIVGELAIEIRDRVAQVSRDWEEGRWAGRTGEWRRRRWVRVVKRVSVNGQGDEVTKS